MRTVRVLTLWLIVLMSCALLMVTVANATETELDQWLAPKPLSEVIRAGYDYEADRIRRGGKRDFGEAGHVAIAPRYKTAINSIRGIEFELDKFRGILKTKQHRSLRYLQDIAKSIEHLVRTAPQGKDLGLSKVHLRSELIAGCIVEQRWMWAEKLLRFNDHDIEIVKLRYEWTEESIRVGLRANRIIKGSS